MEASTPFAGATQRILAALCLVLGLCSVAPLLAWVYGLGTFALWFWALAAPGLLFIAVLALWLRRSGAHSELLVAITAGALGGLVGTIAYDLVRLPFLVVGYRLFAPINSYGLLILNTNHGTPLTDLVGWCYNFANGIGFGVAYAMIGLGRRWFWAIPWALWLETMTIVTPYAGVYGLTGHLDLIAIAYGAHVVYGTLLGLIARQARDWADVKEAPIPVSWALGAVLLVLVASQRPWVVPAELTQAEALQPQPAAIVVGGRWQPEWTRLGVGGCLLLENRDDRVYRLGALAGASPLEAHASASYCFKDLGHQARATERGSLLRWLCHRRPGASALTQLASSQGRPRAPSLPSVGGRELMPAEDKPKAPGRTRKPASRASGPAPKAPAPAAKPPVEIPTPAEMDAIYTIKHLGHTFMDFLKEDLKMALLFMVLAFVIAWLANVIVVAVVYNGFGRVPPGGPAVGSSNQVTGSIFWALSMAILFGMIAYRMQVGGKQFWADMRGFPGSLSKMLRHDGDAAVGHFLWGSPAR